MANELDKMMQMYGLGEAPSFAITDPQAYAIGQQNAQNQQAFDLANPMANTTGDFFLNGGVLPSDYQQFAPNINTQGLSASAFAPYSATAFQASNAPSGSELENLIRHYGLNAASQSEFAGQAGNQADQDVYNQYARDYQHRLKNTAMYGASPWADTLSYLQAPSRVFDFGLHPVTNPVDTSTTTPTDTSMSGLYPVYTGGLNGGIDLSTVPSSTTTTPSDTLVSYPDPTTPFVPGNPQTLVNGQWVNTPTGNVQTDNLNNAINKAFDSSLNLSSVPKTDTTGITQAINAMQDPNYLPQTTQDSALADSLRAIASGVTSYAPNIEAGINSLTGNQTYDQSLAQIQNENKNFQIENPILAPALTAGAALGSFGISGSPIDLYTAGKTIYNALPDNAPTSNDVLISNAVKDAANSSNALTPYLETINPTPPQKDVSQPTETPVTPFVDTAVNSWNNPSYVAPASTPAPVSSNYATDMGINLPVVPYSFSGDTGVVTAGNTQKPSPTAEVTIGDIIPVDSGSYQPTTSIPSNNISFTPTPVTPITVNPIDTGTVRTPTIPTVSQDATGEKTAIWTNPNRYDPLYANTYTNDPITGKSVPISSIDSMWQAEVPGGDVGNYNAFQQANLGQFATYNPAFDYATYNQTGQSQYSQSYLDSLMAYGANPNTTAPAGTQNITDINWLTANPSDYEYSYDGGKTWTTQVPTGIAAISDSAGYNSGYYDPSSSQSSWVGDVGNSFSDMGNAISDWFSSSSLANQISDWWAAATDPTTGWLAKGGYVDTHKYAEGGEVNKLDKLVKKYQPRRFELGGQVDDENTDLPVIPQARLNTQINPNINDLNAKYPDNPIWQEYTAARQKAHQENDLLRTALEKHLSDQPVDKSEMYFRLAAALAAPTRTQGIGEPLSRAAEAMATSKAEERKDRQANALTALKARQGLAELAGTEAKDIGELYSKYAKGNAPLSSAGKQAMDEGLTPGTPAFTARVTEISKIGPEAAEARLNATLGNLAINQANLANTIKTQELNQQKFEEQQKQNAKLTGPEIKLKEETENILSGANQALSDLSTAYKLNPNTFDTSLPDKTQRFFLENAGSKSEILKNTREQENLLSQQAIERLRASFGGNPTEGERAILLSLQGINAKSKEERADILEHAYAALKTRTEMYKKRLNEINQGLYRSTQTPNLGE